MAHPTPPATDVDTVDLRGRYADDELRTLTGLEVEVLTCGDPLDVASGESITVGWEAPADRLDGCDRSTVSVTVSRSVEDGSWSGSLVRHCMVDSDECTLPSGIGGACASATYNEMVSVDLAPEAVVIDGRSFTFARWRPPLTRLTRGVPHSRLRYSGLKRSKGWSQALQYHDARHGVGPNGESSSTSVPSQ